MRAKLKFILLSLLGFGFFLIPMSINGDSKIIMSHISDFITTYFLDQFLLLTILVAFAVMVLSILFIFYTSKSEFLNSTFKTTPLNVGLRVVGSALYLMVFNNLFAGNKIADMILDPDTGGLMAGESGLLTTLYITFFVGILALPLLTEFGIVEFIGILLGPTIKKIFRVPGFSTVDAVASFVGDGTIGIVVTDQQYQRGYYNKREAFIIATSFSVVGISFAAAIADELGFGDIFHIFYGSILLITIIIAFITARLPLKKFPPTYYKGKEPQEIETPKGKTNLEFAYESAIAQADSVTLKEVFLDSIKNIINIYVGFIPVIMTVGTISLIVAEYTSFFLIISKPLIYVYELMGYSKDVAVHMAPASLAGFADMYLPALFVSNVSVDSARFFIGVLAFTQLIFMSETGMILVETEIGLNFLDVVKIFLFRTVISMPILFVIVKGLIYIGVLAS